MGVLARHWERSKDGKVKCLLCPHFCVISEGKSGLCLIRKNVDGMLQQSAYAEPCSVSVDPIEKKPLYHFKPGSDILSVGTNGCNMHCRHCQNWHISTQETTRQSTTPEKLLHLSKSNSSIGIAYTYNEPLVWYEFVYDCAKVFRDSGQKNVLVTNGQINPDPLTELTPLIDAANVDLKGFTEEFYKNEGGFLESTKNTIEHMAKAGVHIEITNLLIPNLNDDEDTFEEMCRYISDISRDIPLHLSRYFPQYKSSQKVTTEKSLLNCMKIASKHLNYVFIGNASIPEKADTFCPGCNKKIIERTGYQTRCLTEENICPDCSHKLSVLF
ncbi:MAG: AmmeMemoRadiSam system radical SAM enzyme [Denitrovibrio sp.]|mgnify:CR=1 FL=1|nr:MAG: AmmeMemoRadiSam system radical SAM enzyme [Denitrovibrio sp.]